MENKVLFIFAGVGFVFNRVGEIVHNDLDNAVLFHQSKNKVDHKLLRSMLMPRGGKQNESK